MRNVLITCILFLATLCGAQVTARFFCFTQNKTAAANFPTWGSFGCQRIWDSPPLQWPSINTSSGVFNFSSLDAMLAQDYQNGVTQVLYDLWRTPTWASSAPTDTTSCHDNGSASGQGPGECYPPNDLASDGSGPNAIWTAWVTAIATHVNNPDYLNGTGAWAAHGANCAQATPCKHAHIAYWEAVNEPDEPCTAIQQCFYKGSLAQLARLVEDTRTFVKAIDPTALILMPPTHAKNSQALGYTQNELYCNKTAGIPSYQLPCPAPGNALAQAIDVVVVHMKPGDETGNTCPVPTPCTVESAMAMYASSIRALLQPREAALPFWDGEATYSPSGFTAPYTNANPGNQASFFPRFYMTLLSQGITLSAFYTSDSISSQSGAIGQTATAQAAKWLVGSTLTPCTASGTVWSCNFTDGAGAAHLAIYDTAQLCTGATCPTSSVNVDASWTTFQDMTAASTPSNITGHAVSVGIKPLVLSRSTSQPPLPPTNLKAVLT